MKKILALMMILMMLSALTLTSGAANTKQEEPPVNFDAVVKEFYKEGEEVTVPGKAPVGESIVYVEPSAVEDMMNVKITEWPSPYLIRVIDEQGEPVPNVNISVLLPSIANPAYAYHLEKSYGISNQEGFVILWLPASYRMTVGMWNSGDKIEKQLVDFDDLNRLTAATSSSGNTRRLNSLPKRRTRAFRFRWLMKKGIRYRVWRCGPKKRMALTEALADIRKRTACFTA